MACVVHGAPLGLLNLIACRQLARLVNLQRIAHSDCTCHLTPLYIYEGTTSALSTLSITQSPPPPPLYIHEGATSALFTLLMHLTPSVYEGATSALSTLLLHPILLEATGWMYLASCTHPTPHKAKPSLCLSLIWE